MVVFGTNGVLKAIQIFEVHFTVLSPQLEKKQSRHKEPNVRPIAHENAVLRVFSDHKYRNTRKQKYYRQNLAHGKTPSKYHTHPKQKATQNLLSLGVEKGTIIYALCYPQFARPDTIPGHFYQYKNSKELPT